jgi:hypothetical protein
MTPQHPNQKEKSHLLPKSHFKGKTMATHMEAISQQAKPPPPNSKAIRAGSDSLVSPSTPRGPAKPRWWNSHENLQWNKSHAVVLPPPTSQTHGREGRRWAAAGRSVSPRRVGRRALAHKAARLSDSHKWPGTGRALRARARTLHPPARPGPSALSVATTQTTFPGRWRGGNPAWTRGPGPFPSAPGRAPAGTAR